MISLKRYLDQAPAAPAAESGQNQGSEALSHAYQATLCEMGQAGARVCPPVGESLLRSLSEAADRLNHPNDGNVAAEVHSAVHASLEDWTRETTAHYRSKAQEVKDILLTLTRVAESVGERDTRCAEQMSAVTARLESIANLEDVTEIRSSIVSSAAELKASVDRMATAGKDAMEALRAEVTTYRTKLEEAEQLAARDTLTGLATRLAAEEQIRKRIEEDTAFSVAVLDINNFKQVNDRHGHIAGDELLRQFAGELRSACRPVDIVSRWGGDEFVVVMDCRLKEAIGRTARLQQWVCGNYTLAVRDTNTIVRVAASVGVAEREPEEMLESLLDRADAAMYREKANVHAISIGDPPVDTER